MKIRLRRMGNRHRAFFRIVVSDSRRTPTSSSLEEIGYYDPKKQPAVVKIDLDRFDAWVGKGAQPSSTVRKLVASARKAEGASAVEAAPATEPAPAVETPPAAEPAPAADTAAEASA